MSRFGDKRSSGTLPVVRTSISPWNKPSNPISSPQLVDRWQYQHLFSDPAERTRNGRCAEGELVDKLPCFYEKVVSHGLLSVFSDIFCGLLQQLLLDTVTGSVYVTL